MVQTLLAKTIRQSKAPRSFRVLSDGIRMSPPGGHGFGSHSTSLRGALAKQSSLPLWLLDCFAYARNDAERFPFVGQSPTWRGRPASLLPPHLVGDLDGEAQLGPLL